MVIDVDSAALEASVPAFVPDLVEVGPSTGFVPSGRLEREREPERVVVEVYDIGIGFDDGVGERLLGAGTELTEEGRIGRREGRLAEKAAQLDT